MLNHTFKKITVLGEEEESTQKREITWYHPKKIIVIVNLDECKNR